MSELREAGFLSLTDEVPEDADYVHVAYHYNDDNGPTVEAGLMEALGDALRETVQERFENGVAYIPNVPEQGGFLAVYLPGPAWEGA